MKIIKTSHDIETIQQAAQQYIERAICILDEPVTDWPKAVHELRVIIKRLRSYWRAHQYLDEENNIYQKHNEKLREASKHLAHCRENYVNRKLILQFEKKAPDQALKNFFHDLIVLFPEENDAKAIDRQYLRTIFENEQVYWQSLLIQNQYLSDWNKSVRKTYRKACTLANKSRHNQFEKNITHQWRKWTKYLMYQLEALNFKNQGKGQKKFFMVLEDLSDQLGKLHDVYVVQEIIQVNIAEATDEALDYIQQKQHKLLKKIKNSFPDAFEHKTLKF